MAVRGRCRRRRDPQRGAADEFRELLVANGGAGADAAEFGRAQARDGSCALEVGALDATSRALLARLYREDFARFGYATEVGASRAAIANNASAGGGAVDPTRVFADDRVGASDFIIGQEIARARRPCR